MFAKLISHLRLIEGISSQQQLRTIPASSFFSLIADSCIGPNKWGLWVHKEMLFMLRWSFKKAAKRPLARWSLQSECHRLKWFVVRIKSKSSFKLNILPAINYWAKKSFFTPLLKLVFISKHLSGYVKLAPRLTSTQGSISAFPFPLSHLLCFFGFTSVRATQLNISSFSYPISSKVVEWFVFLSYSGYIRGKFRDISTFQIHQKILTTYLYQTSFWLIAFLTFIYIYF